MESDLKSIIDETIIHDIPSRYIVPDRDRLPSYQHFTFSIQSLSEYLDIIKVLTSQRDIIIHSDTMVYRGMSDYSWEPIPSIARAGLYDESAEHEMVHEFLTLRPEAFQDLHSNFELLAHMQHYGLPTRLLDFTTNPLIALYFACEENSNKSARIICCNAFLSYTNNEIVEALSSSYLPYSLANLRIEDLLQGTNISAYEYIIRLYLVKDYRLLFAKPKYWNQRIRNQSAIFLIYPNKLFDHLGKICYHQKLHGTNELIGIDDTEETRQRLAGISAHESVETVYPIYTPPDFIKPEYNDNMPILDFTVTYQSMQRLFSNYMESIVRTDTDEHASFMEYGASAFERRFLIDEEIQEIDSETMEKQFCSIVIEAKNKSCILRELESVGIDKAFVYPELEYTAEKIKKKYLQTIF